MWEYMGQVIKGWEEMKGKYGIAKRLLPLAI
jgi:hypothetical protein